MVARAARLVNACAELRPAPAANDKADIVADHRAEAWPDIAPITRASNATENDGLVRPNPIADETADNAEDAVAEMRPDDCPEVRAPMKPVVVIDAIPWAAPNVFPSNATRGAVATIKARPADVAKMLAYIAEKPEATDWPNPAAKLRADMMADQADNARPEPADVECAANAAEACDPACAKPVANERAINSIFSMMPKRPEPIPDVRAESAVAAELLAEPCDAPKACASIDVAPFATAIKRAAPIARAESKNPGVARKDPAAISWADSAADPVNDKPPRDVPNKSASMAAAPLGANLPNPAASALANITAVRLDADSCPNPAAALDASKAAVGAIETWPSAAPVILPSAAVLPVAVATAKLIPLVPAVAASAFGLVCPMLPLCPFV
jgi:hypothetical protein